MTIKDHFDIGGLPIFFIFSCNEATLEEVLSIRGGFCPSVTRGVVVVVVVAVVVIVVVAVVVIVVVVVPLVVVLITVVLLVVVVTGGIRAFATAVTKKGTKIVIGKMAPKL